MPEVKFLPPDEQGHAHIVFKDGSLSVPILTRGAAERLTVVAIRRNLIDFNEAVNLWAEIEESALPDTHPLGEIIANKGNLLESTSIISGGNL